MTLVVHYTVLRVWRVTDRRGGGAGEGGRVEEQGREGGRGVDVDMFFLCRLCVTGYG